MLDDILPSRGLERCPHAADCPYHAENLRDQCVPGEPCPWESWFRDRYVASGRATHKRCLEWMSEKHRDEVLEELSILTLRRFRLSTLVAKEGMIRDKKHPVSGYVYGKQIGLGAGRYSTAIDNRFFPLYNTLIYSPEERETMKAENREHPETMVLPFTAPEKESEPEVEADSHDDQSPVAGWFSRPRSWEHKPGRPARSTDTR